MEEIILLLIQFFGEILFPSLFEIGLDAFLGKDEDKDHSTIILGVTFFVVGIIFAALSIWWLPQSFFHSDILRYGNLVLAPIGSYFLSKIIAQFRSHPFPITQARLACMCTLGFVVTRFIFATN